MTLPEVQSAISEKKICVLIPTYNNAKTLKRVIDGVLQYTENIIVVNDGSTDSTQEILRQYPQITVINLPENKGKGNGLKIGFRKAKKLGYNYAITIDSDGQHYPDDIPVFVEALQNEEEDVLLIGNRNMSQDGIPKKSSFGNRFSNFWFWFETGIKLEDTQSGYRLYPLLHIPKKYITKKFEFEIEVIVRSAWKG
ncbi:MAG: glycosyltransferase family 2 protein, partial [Chryseobacterium taeanense]